MGYPIKDFRDPRQYPEPGAGNRMLRWEFLRRNPEYQAYFAAHCTERATHERFLELRSRFGIRSLADPRIDCYPTFSYLGPGIVNLPTSADWPNYAARI